MISRELKLAFFEGPDETGGGQEGQDTHYGKGRGSLARVVSYAG